MWQGVMDRFGTEVLRIESEAKKFLDESFRALRLVTGTLFFISHIGESWTIQGMSFLFHPPFFLF